ncbi:hypothetical protein F5Y19DRAFT_142680 [Xylariaceae sp. FL1651]|nr:hypothetical protein F5Y19DRAFT_142680 [Xylariaceae sp. FL1651]
MATRSSGPRSVADATRFTSNTPHVNAKSTPNTTGKTSSSPNSASRTLLRRGGMGPSTTQETMEERVRRLRAAHLAAKQHNVSKMDQVIGSSRRFFDAAHKFTVMGLIGFSGIALLVTVYATADMMMYNRKRRNEFFALQKQLKEDSLEAARLAYMTGTASEEQIALVEDATAKAKQAGIALPSILSVPQPAAPAGGHDATTTTTTTAERTVWPGESMAESSMGDAETPKKGGITGWLFSGLKKEETRDDVETLSSSDERWRTASATSTGDVGGALRDKAKAAFEQERDNQRRGGPLDQVGLDATQNGEGKKKGWLW